MMRGSLEGLSGAVLWNTLQRAREDLELAFVLVLTRASTGAIPCADVAQYNDLVAQQIQLERRGLNELQGSNIYTGLVEPAVIPQVTACQTGEQSIWLRPGQAQKALAGALTRYRGLRRDRVMATQRARRPLLGEATLPSLLVAGGVLVGWAAQAVGEHEYSQITSDEVTTHEAAVASYVENSKASLSPVEVQATKQALAQVRGRGSGLPFGLSVPAALLVAFAAGLVLASGAWYIWGRGSSSPTISGSCPRRPRRALVME